MVLLMSMLSMAYVVLLIASLTMAAFGALPVVTALLLLLVLFLSTVSIPYQLAWAREYLGRLIYIFIFNTMFSIAVYALIYYKNGLLNSGVPVEPSYLESLYFSITTWTTLGYGDFGPPSNIALVTSIEALNGLFTVGIFVALIVIWLEETLKKCDKYLNNLPALGIDAMRNAAKESPEMREELRKTMPPEFKELLKDVLGNEDQQEKK